MFAVCHGRDDYNNSTNLIRPFLMFALDQRNIWFGRYFFIMAKRFISTDLFDDDWFMELKPTTKLLWVYFITKCDHAGIISFNEKLCKFQTGLNDVQGCLKDLKSRIFKISDTQYFIPKFIYFQYPDFPNSKVNQQKGAISILRKYNLVVVNQDNIPTSLVDVQSLSKTYVYDNVNGNDNGKGESEGAKPPKPKIEIPTYLDFLEYFKSLKEVYKPELEFGLKAKYDTWVESGWKDGYNKPILNWKTKLQNAIQYLKPVYNNVSQNNSHQPPKLEP